MGIRFFQIIVPVISLVFILGLHTRYRKGRLTLREFIFSFTFWLCVGIFSVFPDPISNFLADVLDIKSNVNAVIFVGQGITLYLVYLLYGEVRENRRQVTELTRQIALRDAEEPDQQPTQ